MKIKDNHGGSFFGEYLYDKIVPQDHFLRKLRELVPWNKYTYRLIKYYRGKGEIGRPPIDPALVLKMLLLSYLYDLSERDVVRFCQLNLAAKCFLGVAVDASIPNHSTLSVFKKRILENGRIEAYEKMLQCMIQDARDAGITFGALQLVDSTHSVADVNPSTNEARRKDAHDDPPDPDARWGVKGSYAVTDQEGNEQKRIKYFYGYKMHTSMNAESQMITSLIASRGNRYDGHFLTPLMQRDLGQGIPVSAVAADRGYDNTEIHFWLEEKGIHNAIHLNRYRTQKKDANKDRWIKLKEQPWYRESLGLRYQVERKFGEGKKHHGLGRCRYRGLDRYTIQAYLTALALNFKQLVRALAGTSLRGPALKRS